MEERLCREGKLVEIDHFEAVSVRGGAGFSSLKNIIKLIGNFLGFMYEYYDDFKKGYENGWKMVK